MNDFIVYALKSVLALALFALVYRITFLNEGNFLIRRVYLLLSVSLATISNHFNYSHNKNRIAMMNKEKNGKRNSWKLILLLPISLMLAFLFVCTNIYSQAGDSIKNDNPIFKKSVYVVVDQIPVFPGGTQEMLKFISANVKYPVEASKHKVQGTVIIQFVIDENGKVDTKTMEYEMSEQTRKSAEIIDNGVVIRYTPEPGSPTENVEQYVKLIKKEAVRVVSSLPNFEKPGMQNGKAVPVIYTMPIRFVLK